MVKRSLMILVLFTPMLSFCSKKKDPNLNKDGQKPMTKENEEALKKLYALGTSQGYRDEINRLKNQNHSDEDKKTAEQALALKNNVNYVWDQILKDHSSLPLLCVDLQQKDNFLQWFEDGDKEAILAKHQRFNGFVDMLKKNPLKRINNGVFVCILKSCCASEKTWGTAQALMNHIRNSYHERRQMIVNNLNPTEIQELQDEYADKQD